MKTIAALASSPGISGLSVIRISGKSSISLIDSIFVGKIKISDAKSHTIHYGKILDNNILVDTVTISVFKSPNSYTGEDVIEIGCHGGNVVYKEILNLLYKAGAEIPLAGEFTKRAFLNNKLDLTQVEAVADLIHSLNQTSAQTSARQLLGSFTKKLKELRQQLLDIAGFLELENDFAEEDITFLDRSEIKKKITETIDYCKTLLSSYKSSNIIKSGFYVSFVGYPNSGKSSLFNTMLNKNRAIVSDFEGTTRDYLEEFLYINDIPIKLFDTAGLRETDNIIEIEGIKLVETVLQQSNLIFVLNDISQSSTFSDSLYSSLSEKYSDVFLLHNKIDLSKTKDYELCVSAKSSEGIDNLKEFIYKKAETSFARQNDVLLNDRHFDLINLIIKNLITATSAIDNGFENEIISIDLHDAILNIGKITGETYSEEVINNIFSNFCIGK